MSELKYIIEKNGEIQESQIISDTRLYPFITENLRKDISREIMTRELFWKTQNLIKIFPFFYKEALKN